MGTARAMRLAAAGLGLALVAGCTQDTERWSAPPTTASAAPVAPRLVAAEGCDELVERVREPLRVAARSGSLDVMAAEPAPLSGPAAEGNGATSAAESGRAAARGDVEVGANLQVEGVDEGDLVVTDGRRIVTAVDGVVRVTVLDGDPAVDGELDLRDRFSGGPAQLLLRGDEVLVVGSAAVPSAGGPTPRIGSGPDRGMPDFAPITGTGIVRVSVSEPDRPRAVESTIVEGQVVATRQADGVARIVLRSVPVVAWGVTGDSGDVERELRRLDAGDVLPVRVDDGQARPLGRCSDVFVEEAGDDAVSTDVVAQVPERLTVLTVRDSLEDLAPVTILGAADTVLATDARLYAAHAVWDGAGQRTAIHRFDLSGDGPARYTATGVAPGQLLNQYSLSERGEDLRVVTTVWDGGAVTGPAPGSADVTTNDVRSPDRSAVSAGPTASEATLPGTVPTTTPVTTTTPTTTVPPTTTPTTTVPPTTAPTTTAPTTTSAPPAVPAPPTSVVEPAPMPTRRPESAGRLTVLRPDGTGALVEVGHLDDLGVGETVRSVRFVDDPVSGDLAYVVTFRQIDPLFAISLAEPTAPRLLGQLKIPGFSSYLHPLGDGRLLGIGREVDPATAADLGMKVSLFDVSDPTAPRESATLVLSDRDALVTGEPLAFAWDGRRSQAVVPTTRYATAGDPPAPFPEPAPVPLPGPDRPVGDDTVEPGWSGPGTADLSIAPSGSALVIGVEGDRLVIRGDLEHPRTRDAWADGTVLRSRVVDGTLWTVSASGLGRTSADAPTGVTFLPY
jgi:hypothetical protein